MSSTAYSGGGPSEPDSSSELSGSKASSLLGGLTAFCVFGGLDGSLPPPPETSASSGWLTCLSELGSSALAPSALSLDLGPLPEPFSRSAPGPPEEALPSMNGPGPGCSPSAMPLERLGAARLFSACEGAHSFFSFQPEFSKSSVIGRIAIFGGPRGAKDGEVVTGGAPPHEACVPRWPSCHALALAAGAGRPTCGA